MTAAQGRLGLEGLDGLLKDRRLLQHRGVRHARFMQPPGSRIFQVWGETAGGDPLERGSRRTRAEAETLIAELQARHRDRGLGELPLRIQEVDTSGMWALPSRPTPRERFTADVTEIRRPTGWPTVHVDVRDGDHVAGAYDRNYAMLQTFEPFRQGDRHFALVSPHYTATSVMDLATGQIIASETPDAEGFCPVGFYVPDWWDVHDGTRLPGSTWWRPHDHEWPDGMFGFVWGCIWVDDSFWKVQYLDLSRVQNGVIARDERFGYLRLATKTALQPREFIRCSSWQGRRRVEFDVPQAYYLDSGGTLPEEDW